MRDTMPSGMPHIEKRNNETFNPCACHHRSDSNNPLACILYTVITKNVFYGFHKTLDDLSNNKRAVRIGSFGISWPNQCPSRHRTIQSPSGLLRAWFTTKAFPDWT